MKLSVHLVTWNGSKYIPYLFDSLRKQIFTDWKLFVWDNGSTDGTVEAMKKELQDPASSAGKFPVEYELIENKENKGFAGGHNLLYKDTRNKFQDTNEYCLLVNQDMWIHSKCLQRLVEFMDKHPEVGSATPALLKWEFNKIVAGFDASITETIDSLGLRVERNRRMREMVSGAGFTEVAKKINATVGEIFGVSGALPIFRLQALDEVAFSDGTFLDELYHAYKEDIDLAYRLQAAGWQSRFLLSAIALHDRSAAGPMDPADRAAAENKQQQSEWVRYHSYKNHLMTLYKNEYWQNLILDFPWIVWYELKKFGWFLLFDRAVLKGLSEVWKNRKDLKIKRLKIKEARKKDWRWMRRWWTSRP